MVGVLQVLLQQERLKIADLPERETLLKEFRTFRIKLKAETGHATFEAWRESDHDDLVFSVGLPCWLSEKGTRAAGGLRVLNLRPKHSNVLSEKECQGRLHIVVCRTEQLAGVVCDDHDTALVVVDNPPPVGVAPDEAIPLHGLSRLQGSLRLSFTPLDPQEHGPTWHDKVEPYDRTAADLAMSQQDGKRLWYFLRKKCDPSPQVLVLASPDGQAALSMAYAICDVLRISRPETVYPFDTYDPDDKQDRNPPFRHVYKVTRETRSMVV
jgi:hypothetical protein